MSDGLKHELDELLAAVDLERYLDHEGIDYEKRHGARGMQLNVRTCPACGSDKSKVYLNAETGLGNCFAGDCHVKTFNKFSFIKHHIGGGTIDVKRHLRQVVRAMGLRLKTKAKIAVEIETPTCKLPESIELPTPEGENLAYLLGRGIDNDLTAYFHLRYCQRGWHVFKKQDGEFGTQNFAERCIIPVFDLGGVLQTFQGRDIVGTSDRKYLFPAGLPGTAKYLYNGHNAIGAKRIVIGEGAFDIFALKKALAKYDETSDVVPVGTFGKHLSVGRDGADQFNGFIQLVQLGLKEATFMWDGEQQALLDALEGARRVAALGVKTRVALLPAGCDPNEVDDDANVAAFLKAREYSRQLEIEYKLRNPYKISHS